MKVVILGAKGFVGSALSERLVGMGHDVIRLGRPEFDLTDPSTFVRIPADVEVLIHSAGQVGATENDDLAWKTNVHSSFYLGKYLRSWTRTPLMIYLSSGAVYGMNRHVVTCADGPHPEGLYGVSKFLSEQMFETMLSGRLVILRLFFPFGPRQKLPRFIPSLVARIARGEEVEITNAGGPVVNPIYIEDLVNQVALIMSERRRSCYNLGGASEVTVKSIAETIAGVLDVKARFSIKNENSGLNMVCTPDLPSMVTASFEEVLESTTQALMKSLNLD